jgi:hypothetical protein
MQNISLLVFINIKFFFNQCECPGQLACTLTNPTGPEVNDHVSLQ